MRAVAACQWFISSSAGVWGSITSRNVFTTRQIQLKVEVQSPADTTRQIQLKVDVQLPADTTRQIQLKVEVQLPADTSSQLDRSS